MVPYGTLGPSRRCVQHPPTTTRYLPSHLIHVAAVKPTSDVRRRQLVHAQRRSRKKARLVKRLATPAVPPPPGSRDPSHAATYHAFLTHRFMDYLALVTEFTKSQCPPTPTHMFTNDVECNGVYGRRGVEALWIKWAALCPGYRFLVVSTDVVQVDSKFNMLLQVKVALCFHVRGKDPLTQDNVPVAPSNVVVHGDLVVHFDGATGSISKLVPCKDLSTPSSWPHDTRDSKTPPRTRPRRDADADDVRSKMSFKRILHAVGG
ncbi:hypothetical protein H310_12818 [Aphanomyces invadans]|uniref:Uncharacterized protein n=1 Tax=Aphanomyces invadans TaxID=157072 RepID=A0A024TIN0_9STRA|nr:hypothetical protein H310_12818 [Aphanomyces invadans]ETV93222.1 hypothetical protein H310_12818 [Aphanomyces invadans]|eukprot:XP_008878244.1 hypothetical protein H310_12818 [Aphanomyces invadans]